MSYDVNRDLSEQWIKGLGGDFELLQRYGDSELQVWHSSDGIWEDGEQQRQKIAHMMTMDHPPRLLDLRATVTERGFIVQAHVDGLPGSSGDGPSLRTHILQMCTVLSGKVTRIEEYLSPEDPRARPSSRAQLDSDRQ